METTLSKETEMRKGQSAFQDWMIARGIKQSWLSEKSGLKEPLISKIATKKTKPDVFQARHILHALQEVTQEVTIDDLWPMEEEKK